MIDNSEAMYIFRIKFLNRLRIKGFCGTCPSSAPGATSVPFIACVINWPNVFVYQSDLSIFLSDLDYFIFEFCLSFPYFSVFASAVECPSFD